MLFPEFLSRGDIHRRIAVSMTLYAICVILLIGAVSYVCIGVLIRKNLRLSVESTARQQAVKLSAHWIPCRRASNISRATACSSTRSSTPEVAGPTSTRS